MTVRHYEEKDTPKMEVWVGSGLSDNLSGQVTIIDLSDNAVEVGRIPKEIFTFTKGCDTNQLLVYSQAFHFSVNTDESVDKIIKKQQQHGCKGCSVFPALYSL